MSEFLQAARVTGLEDNTMAREVETLFRGQISQLLDIQSPGGLWPNILTNKQTFLETSASAMFLTGVGFDKGQLSKYNDNVFRNGEGPET